MVNKDKNIGRHASTFLESQEVEAGIAIILRPAWAITKTLSQKTNERKPK